MTSKMLQKTVVFLSIILIFTLLTQVSQAETREFIVVNIETPQAVKIWQPTTLIVKKSDVIKLKLINKTEQEHGFRINDLKIEKIVQGGQAETIEFKADKEGIFTIDCQLHPAHVQGQFVVLP